MPDLKISELPALVGAPADGDLVVLVDVSTGETRKAEWSTVLAAVVAEVPEGEQGPPGAQGDPGPNTVAGLIQAGANVTITGAGTSGSPYVVNASGGGGGGSGTVTSVGLAVPSGLTVTGSPVTGSGVIEIATSLSGIVKAAGSSGFQTATAGVDYLAPSGDGGSLTGLNASALSTGTVPAARLETVNANVGPGYNTVTVDAKGRVTAASTTAYLTANQTITLSGDLTGSGSTSINAQIAAGAVGTAEIADDAVTFAKLPNATGARLVGASAAGDFGEIVVGSGLSLSAGTLTATGGGSGTVTSVGLTVPSGLSVSGSPVTGSGTLAITTSLSGLVKADGSGFAAAVAGTDYVRPDGLTTALTDYAKLNTAQTFTATQTFGTSGVAIGTVSTSSTLTSAQTELILECTGDAMGTVRMKMRNRNGSNGVIFEQAAPGAAIPIDFAFSATGSGGSSRSIRFEPRSGNARSASAEFQIGNIGSGGYCALFDSGAIIPTGLCVYSGADTTAPLIAATGATLDVRGSIRIKRKAVTATPYTVLNTDCYLAVTGPASARVLNMMTTAPPSGFILTVKDAAGDAGTNNITINAASTKTIDGSASYVISTNRGVVRLVADGSGNWDLI